MFRPDRGITFTRCLNGGLLYIVIVSQDEVSYTQIVFRFTNCTEYKPHCSFNNYEYIKFVSCALLVLL